MASTVFPAAATTAAAGDRHLGVVGVKKPNPSALPVQVGPGNCPECLAAPGHTHELSCPEVSYEQMRAEFDRLREEWRRWDRRDHLMGLAGWWLLFAALLLAASLIWLVTR